MFIVRFGNVHGVLNMWLLQNLVLQVCIGAYVNKAPFNLW